MIKLLFFYGHVQGNQKPQPERHGGSEISSEVFWAYNSPSHPTSSSKNGPRVEILIGSSSQLFRHDHSQFVSNGGYTSSTLFLENHRPFIDHKSRQRLPRAYPHHTLSYIIHHTSYIISYSYLSA